MFKDVDSTGENVNRAMVKSVINVKILNGIRKRSQCHTAVCSYFTVHTEYAQIHRLVVRKTTLLAKSHALLVAYVYYGRPA